MQLPFRSRCLWLGLGLILSVWTGCVDGPFGGLGGVNPWVRKKWAEDEKYGPTYHRRLADLRGLKTSARQLDAQKKDQIASDMAELVQSDPSSVLRSEAVGVLAELDTASAIPALRAALNDEDEDVRIAACRGWGRVGGSESLLVLAQVAQTEGDVDVRLAALEELGKFKEAAAVEALGKALDDSDPAVQVRAVASLKSVTGLDYGDSVPAWRDYVQGRTPSTPRSPSVVERIRDWF